MKKRVFGVPCAFVVKLEKLDNNKYPLTFSVWSRVAFKTSRDQHVGTCNGNGKRFSFEAIHLLEKTSPKIKLNQINLIQIR